MLDVVDGTQTTMFGVTIPRIGAKPTTAEIERALRKKVRTVIFRWHRGRPPKGMTFDDLHQDVAARTLLRLRKFRHGGKFSLGEFTYVAACFALRDIQRIDMRVTRPPPEYPLLAVMEQMQELPDGAEDSA